MADRVVKLAAWRLGLKRVPGWVWQIGIAMMIYAVVSAVILRAYPDVNIRLRLSFEPILSAPPMVQVHVAAAMTCFSVGLMLLFAPKGLRFHRTFGWVWLVSMAVTAGSSFFLTGLMGGAFSPIHALSAWMLIALPFGIAAVKRKNIKQHRQAMTEMFMGGMVIAGLFAFLPGRLMWDIFFAT